MNSGSVSKGQSQIVAAVLLTMVIIILVSVTYFWGVPLIEKQKDTVTISNMERFMKTLNEKIQYVAKSGGTTKIESINIPESLVLSGSDINDVITLNFKTTGNIIATNADIFLVGDSQTEGVPLGSEPGVIKVYSEKLGDKYSVKMSLYYRELVGAINSYKIDLVALGRTRLERGTHNIIISEGGTNVIEEGGWDNKDLYITKVNIRFE